MLARLVLGHCVIFSNIAETMADNLLQQIVQVDAAKTRLVVWDVRNRSELTLEALGAVLALI